MNRATFLSTLAGGTFLLSQNAPGAETPEEKSIYDAVDAIIDAQFTLDFERLASLLHESSMRLFRGFMSARFDQLLRYFAQESICAISGLPGHPKDLKLSDNDHFVTVCKAAAKLHPDVVGTARMLPLSIQGTIFERQQTNFVLFSYADSIHTERTDLDFIQPNVLTFHRNDDGTWLLRSCLLARRIADNWWRDLSGPRGSNGLSIKKDEPAAD
jgi:hypothetical protein